MKKTLLTSALALGLAFGAAPSFAETYFPIIAKGFSHQFWQAVKAGAEEAAAANGVTITFEGPETEAMIDKQIDMLNAAIAKKPAGIGFAALDSQAQVPLLQKAVDAGIPIVAFDSGVDSDIPVTTATTNNVAAAALAADKMAELGISWRGLTGTLEDIAALDLDIKEGGTMLGFGVKFPAEGAQMAGQNERSFPVVIQYIDDKSYVVWPKSQAMREAVLPLPKGTTYSNQ